MFRLDGKIALVTGGNGGIGLGMARGLAQSGATVLVVGRDAAKSAEAVRGLKADGFAADSLEADVTSERSVQQLFEEAVRRHGRVDILVNNAGTNIRHPPHLMPLEAWNTVMDTNLTSAFLCSRAAHASMKASGGGKVINIGSIMSVFAAPYAPAYAASKGGIVQFTKSAAIAWAPDNIQCNAVLPGWIDSDMTRKARAEVPGLNERILARTPAGRWGQPSDLAGIAVFLASAASDFMTGSVLTIDGGYSIS